VNEICRRAAILSLSEQREFRDTPSEKSQPKKGGKQLSSRGQVLDGISRAGSPNSTFGCAIPDPPAAVAGGVTPRTRVVLITIVDAGATGVAAARDQGHERGAHALDPETETAGTAEKGAGAAGMAAAVEGSRSRRAP